MINRNVNEEGKINFKKFMAVETKEERINDKADIWETACILYYFLTGKDTFKTQEKF